MHGDTTRHRTFCALYGYLTVIVLFFVLAPIAVACSLSLPETAIEARVNENLLSQTFSCLDPACIFTLERDVHGYFSIENTGAGGQDRHHIGSVDREGGTISIGYLPFDNGDPQLDETAFIEALETMSERDISDIAPILFREIEDWTTRRRTEPFLGGTLTFTPYEPKKEFQLLQEKGRLLECDYAEYKRAGDWLVVQPASREYCRLTGGDEGVCPHTTMSYPQFVVFLLSHPNKTTAPYLAVLLLVVLGSAALGTYLVRKKISAGTTPSR